MNEKSESETCELVRRSVGEIGVKRTSAALMLSAEAVCRLAGGLKTQRGTIFQARERAAVLEAVLSETAAAAAVDADVLREAQVRLLSSKGKRGQREFHRLRERYGDPPVIDNEDDLTAA